MSVTYSCDRFACLKASGRVKGRAKVLRGRWILGPVCAHCGGVGERKDTLGLVLRVVAE